MDTVTTWILALCTLSFVLGFVALLSSRIYVNPNTKAKTAVQVPLFGKLQTNYPALFFVFMGSALAFLALQHNFDLAKRKLERPRMVDWVIKGQLHAPDNRRVDWLRGQITIVPENYSAQITNTGQFQLSLQIEEGQTFESFVQRVDYTSEFGSAGFVPQDELEAFRKDKNGSRLSALTRTTRVYRPIEVTLFPE